MTAKLLPIGKMSRQKRLRNTLNALFQLVRSVSPASVYFLSLSVFRYDAPLVNLIGVCSMQWGYVVVTTPDGILDHEEAIKRNVGGQVLGFFY